MIILIIILSILVVLDIIDFFRDSEDFSVLSFLGSCARGGLIGFTVMIIIGAVSMEMEDSKPTALDVYRGETKLQVNYTDGIPTDSVVVWKDCHRLKH